MGYPDMNVQSGRFFDFDTGTYMDADQVANGEIFVDPQTVLQRPLLLGRQ